MRDQLDIQPQFDGAVWYYGSRVSYRRTHRHDELEFNLVVQGQATYLVCDRRHDLRRHTLLWLFPEQDHVLMDHSDDFHMWIVVFKPALLQRLCTTPRTATLTQGNPKGEFCRDLTPAQARQIATLLQEFRDQHCDRFNASLAYCLMLAWDCYESAEVLSPSREVHPAIEKAARLIRDEHDSRSLEDLARQVGMSPWRLSRLFRRQTGVSLVAYRQRQRLQRFLELYDDGSKLKMLDAALQAGFGSYPQFHRVFKRYLGRSPAEHRKRARP